MLQSSLCRHLFKLQKTGGGEIILRSLTANLTRLLLTIALCLLITYCFSISGWLFFQNYHVDGNVENPNGPCANLLTCFFSYGYAGLMGSGIGDYITVRTQSTIAMRMQSWCSSM
eukprot:SAG11_NODE_32_length_22830_cov_17.507941_21_plen_115_part_00